RGRQRAYGPSKRTLSRAGGSADQRAADQRRTGEARAGHHREQRHARRAAPAGDGRIRQVNGRFSRSRRSGEGQMTVEEQAGAEAGFRQYAIEEYHPHVEPYYVPAGDEIGLFEAAFASRS